MRAFGKSWFSVVAALALAACSGATGPQGSLGASGASGASGPTGATGPSGSEGPTGAKGATGATGLGGQAGQAGQAGASGSEGATGSTGPAGVIDLPDGGSIGEDAGIVILVGPMGPVGLAGATGPVGATGAVGATGPVGPTGPNAIGAGTTFGVGVIPTSALQGSFAQLAPDGSLIWSQNREVLAYTPNGGKTVYSSIEGIYCGGSVPPPSGVFVDSASGTSGYRAAKVICEGVCNSKYAHMCSLSEVVRSAQMGVLTAGLHLWVSSGKYTEYSNTGDRDCLGWTDGSSSTLGSDIDTDTGGPGASVRVIPDIDYCDNRANNAIGCCE